jgi:cell division control protein 45
MEVLDKYAAIGNSYSEPISSLVYSLAAELGREDNDLLWLAIVGVTSLELSGYTSTGMGTSRPKANHLPTNYHKSWKATRSAKTYAVLRDEVRRLNPPTGEDAYTTASNYSSTPSSPSDNSIRLSPDPRFLLLRHWSLYDSMLHSPYLAARLHVWKDDGVKRLHKLLAKMGVSLTQCKQTYTHMDMDLKRVLRERLLQYAGVYGLDDIVPAGSGGPAYDQEGWGFVRSWGWKAQLSAIDVGLILGAILDVGSGNSAVQHAAFTPPSEGSSQLTTQKEDIADRTEALVPRFFAAYDALAPSHPTQLLGAIPVAQHLLRAIHRTGSGLMSKKQMRHLRAFRLSVLKEGPDLALFANSPGALAKLALWLSESVEIVDRDRKGIEEATPLVLAALDELRNTYLVVGMGGGIGAAGNAEARKEKAEAKAKKLAEKEEKRKKRREERDARREMRRAALGDDDDDATDSESEEESSDDDDSEDEEDNAASKVRGYGHNRFGIAFQEVVDETNARVKIDSFDHCIVEVEKGDLTSFLETLSLKSVVGR